LLVGVVPAAAVGHGHKNGDEGHGDDKHYDINDADEKVIQDTMIWKMMKTIDAMMNDADYDNDDNTSSNNITHMIMAIMMVMMVMPIRRHHYCHYHVRYIIAARIIVIVIIGIIHHRIDRLHHLPNHRHHH
jgi:hypothetical protein